MLLGNDMYTQVMSIDNMDFENFGKSVIENQYSKGSETSGGVQKG